MNFSGFKYATLDEKGRVVLPADYKNDMGGRIPDGRLAVEIDPYEKCLNIYPMDAWEKRLSSLTAKLDMNIRKHSQLLDWIYQRFKIMQVPDSCRINLPKNFLDIVNISKDVVFSGQGVRIRLWDAQYYNTYMNSMGSTFGDSFESIFGEQNQI